MADGETVDVRSIYALVTSNDLQGIRSRLNPLTLRHRQSIGCQTIANNTLLGHACELGFRDIVKYLLDECGAESSQHSTACPMSLSPLRISINNLDVSMLTLLISRGVVVGDKQEARTCSNDTLILRYFSIESMLRGCIYGNSELIPVIPMLNGMDLNDDPDAILTAAANGDVDEMKILIANGINAKGINSSYDNALCVAILNKQSNAEHFLLNYRIFTLKDYVRALEFSGAKYIALESDMEQGLKCWRKSLRIRKEYFFGVSDKFSNKLESYLGTEFSCEEQLDVMANAEAEINIQALMVYARLLSPNFEYLHNVFMTVVRKSVFCKDLLQAIRLLAELAKFPYVPLGMHVDPVNRFTREFRHVLRDNYYSDPLDVEDVLSRCKHLMAALNGLNWNVLLRGENDFHQDVYLELLRLLLRNIIALNNFDPRKYDELWIKEGLGRIHRLHSDPYPTTLLHLSIQEPTAFSVVPFILGCSADANCTNSQKQTPMHAASSLTGDDSHILRLVNLLADAGGHIDAVNLFDTTPFHILKMKSIVQNPLKFISLQCLVAQKIHKCRIDIPEMYPKILISYLNLHSN